MLEPSESFAPDSARGFAKLRRREGRYRVAQRFWVGGTAAAAVLLCVLMLAMPARVLCCTRPDVENYKQSGPVAAPVVIEIYSDFECPACAEFYQQIYPALETQYVATGRVRIVHRDFPLPQHKYAKLAARYANAAGELGVYETVAQRLFATQAQWNANGNIEAALAPAVTPELLQRIHAKVGADTKLEASEAADVQMGRGADQINQTPTLIVVTPDGKRHKLAGAPSFAILKAYLDELIH